MAEANYRIELDAVKEASADLATASSDYQTAMSNFDKTCAELYGTAWQGQSAEAFANLRSKLAEVNTKIANAVSIGSQNLSKAQEIYQTADEEGKGKHSSADVAATKSAWANEA